MANALTKPGAASMLGSPSIFKIDVNSYVIARHRRPHRALAHRRIRATQLLIGNVRFVLSTSGHIAAMVNPPAQPEGDLRLAPQQPARPPRMAGSGRDGPGQLVAGLHHLAGGPQR